MSNRASKIKCLENQRWTAQSCISRLVAKWCLIFRSFLQKSRCPRHIRLNEDYPMIAKVKSYMFIKKTSLDIKLCAVQRWFSKLFIFEARLLSTPCIFWRSNGCKRISSSSRFEWYHTRPLAHNRRLRRRYATSEDNQLFIILNARNCSLF